MKKFLLAAGLAAAAVPVQAATLTDLFDSFFVVGDSLSDNGNTAQMFGAINAQQATPIPVPPPSSLQQPGVSSDGFTWARSFTETFAAAGKSTANLSFGAARARDNGDGPPDLTEQLLPGTSFTTSFTVPVAPGTNVTISGTVPKYPDSGGGLLSRIGDGSARELVTFFIGGNDFRDAFAETDPALQAAILGAAFTSIQSNMFAARGAGVEDFILMNIPDFTALPGANLLPDDHPVTLQLRTVVSGFNANLSALANALRGSGAIVTEVDVFGLLNDSEKLGFFGDDFDITNACPAVNAVSPLPSCDGFLFWDDIHPTRQGHQLLAMAANEALARTYGLQPVPLPAPALMLLTGLGGLVLARRRRAR